MFCLATFSIDGIPSIFNSVVAKELIQFFLRYCYFGIKSRFFHKKNKKLRLDSSTYNVSIKYPV